MKYVTEILEYLKLKDTSKKQINRLNHLIWVAEGNSSARVFYIDLIKEVFNDYPIFILWISYIHTIKENKSYAFLDTKELYKLLTQIEKTYEDINEK